MLVILFLERREYSLNHCNGLNDCVPRLMGPGSVRTLSDLCQFVCIQSEFRELKSNVELVSGRRTTYIPGAIVALTLIDVPLKDLPQRPDGEG